MTLNYDFTAKAISQAGLEPQIDKMGMIEFHFNKPKVLAALGQDAKRTLMLGLKAYELPTSREVNTDTVSHLNGKINFATTPKDLTDGFSITIYDYINGPQRDMLHRWFDLVYDARKGYGELTSEIKVDAHAVLFGRNAAAARTDAAYVLWGLFPTNDPQLPSADYSGDGSIVEMKINFSLDDFDREPINPTS